MSRAHRARVSHILTLYRPLVFHTLPDALYDSFLIQAAHEGGVPPTRMQQELELMVGTAKLGKCMLVEQLIFVEELTQ